MLRSNEYQFNESENVLIDTFYITTIEEISLTVLTLHE